MTGTPAPQRRGHRRFRRWAAFVGGFGARLVLEAAMRAVLEWLSRRDL